MTHLPSDQICRFEDSVWEFADESACRRFEVLKIANSIFELDFRLSEVKATPETPKSALKCGFQAFLMKTLRLREAGGKQLSPALSF